LLALGHDYGPNMEVFGGHLRVTRKYFWCLWIKLYLLKFYFYVEKKRRVCIWEDLYIIIRCFLIGAYFVFFRKLLQSDSSVLLK